MTRKARALFGSAPVDWERKVDKLTSKERDELRREFEGISLRAGELAAYIDQRHGFGCGDQGHGKAVKAMMKAGHVIWCKAFGYNAFHDFSF